MISLLISSTKSLKANGYSCIAKFSDSYLILLFMIPNLEFFRSQMKHRRSSYCDDCISRSFYYENLNWKKNNLPLTTTQFCLNKCYYLLAAFINALIEIFDHSISAWLTLKYLDFLLIFAWIWDYWKLQPQTQYIHDKCWQGQLHMSSAAAWWVHHSVDPLLIIHTNLLSLRLTLKCFALSVCVSLVGFQLRLFLNILSNYLKGAVVKLLDWT